MKTWQAFFFRTESITSSVPAVIAPAFLASPRLFSVLVLFVSLKIYEHLLLNLLIFRFNLAQQRFQYLVRDFDFEASVEFFCLYGFFQAGLVFAYIRAAPRFFAFKVYAYFVFGAPDDAYQITLVFYGPAAHAFSLRYPFYCRHIFFTPIYCADVFMSIL